MTSPTRTPWPQREPPSLAACEPALRQERLSAPRPWSNAPGDRYGTHWHPCHKVLYCVHDSIRFVIAPSSAVVGPPGRHLHRGVVGVALCSSPTLAPSTPGPTS